MLYFVTYYLEWYRESKQRISLPVRKDEPLEALFFMPVKTFESIIPSVFPTALFVFNCPFIIFKAFCI